jgi:hypothetical protein
VDLTKDVPNRYHNCPGLSGLNAPLVEVIDFDQKIKARHVLVNREDGPEVASCRTERMDGSNDLTAYAPTAVMELVHHRPALNRAMKDISVNAEMAFMGGRANHHRFFDPKVGRMARIARQVEAQMVWTTSNGNAYFLWSIGQATARPNPSADTFKVALYNNTVVPAQSATAALTQYAGTGSTWAGNEITGTGYTATGVNVTPVTWTQTTNVITFTSSGSPQWTSASFTAYGCLVYDTSASMNNQAISWNYFGGAQTVTSGTFSITWNASGILTLTC